MGRGDDRGLVDVERASAEPDDAQHERERWAEVRQRPIGDGEQLSHESSERPVGSAVCAGTLTAPHASGGPGWRHRAVQSQRFQRKNASWASVVATISPTETPSVQ